MYSLRQQMALNQNTEIGHSTRPQERLQLVQLICSLQILYLQIHLLKFICNPQINICSASVVLNGHALSDETFKLPNVHVPS